MAIPKVFVSSTCFDLKEVRDSLSRFIKSFGFDPVLSEHGDVFYHPDLHTHEACIHEVANCQLFILIIGGRFGGEYKNDKDKSITNAEYEAALESNIPVFTYIKKGIYDNHNTFQANKSKKFIKDMDFPNIEKQEHAIDIFNFIDQVRKAKTNNSFETFEVSNDIEVHLKKQWAGMFFEFLKNREVKEQVNAANIMLSGLQTSSEKLEEMLKGLYQPEEDTLENIESKYSAIKFFKLILERKNGIEGYIGTQEELERLSKVDPKNCTWFEYLEKLKCFKLMVDKDGDKILKFIGIGEIEGNPVISFSDENRKTFEQHYQEVLSFFKDGLQKLSITERRKILAKFTKATNPPK